MREWRERRTLLGKKVLFEERKMCFFGIEWEGREVWFGDGFGMREVWFGEILQGMKMKRMVYITLFL